MTINDKVRDEKMQYVINREPAKIHYHKEKLIKINILQAKKYYFLMKLE